ncbi:hypothetical protein [Zoogloea sp. LCSB751]|uniref:hypothetical protein n=1 Tax=Zoogloea sp. LCSB751 TaxID=1965277 RepID=UPI0009A4B37B|nr:hypothetical protein [Zoogloea sp. LCSB751]
MKLSQLALGTRFAFEGKIYTKTGPMTASAESGGQRMIPRYAVLQPLDGVPPPVAPAASRTVDADTVRSAFDAFYGTCLRLTDDFGRAELETARQRFLESLEK